MTRLWILLVLAAAHLCLAKPDQQTITILQELQTAAREQQERVAAFAAEHQLARQWQANGQLTEMVDVRGQEPIYYTTFNARAAEAVNATALWASSWPVPTGLDGSGYDYAAIWDGGGVRTTHQEFEGDGGPRVHQGDSPSSITSHATHCAGTMIAAGVSEYAKGMAPGALLTAYDWSSDAYEMSQAAQHDNLEISNHSYGIVAGWHLNSNREWQWFGDPSISKVEDYKFGYYDYTAKTWDDIAYRWPNYLIVKAAGNDVGDGPYNASPPRDGGADGYDTLTSSAVSKNVLTIGSVLDVTSYTGPEDVQLAGYSSCGPTDDGRIKPDIVTNGYYLNSTSSGGDASYSVKSGTSMAAASASGSLVLLQQAWRQLTNHPMRSATLKALVVHTARECGPFPGPDFKYGWGLLDLQAAVELIRKHHDTSPLVFETRLENGDSLVIPIRHGGEAPLKITLAWTDPPGHHPDYVLDPPDPMLVNNLDVRLERQSDGEGYFPFALNGNNPSAPAIKTINNADNVEQILLVDSVEGDYDITVSHQDQLFNGFQDFSIVISGAGTDLESPQVVKGLTISE